MRGAHFKLLVKGEGRAFNNTDIINNYPKDGEGRDKSSTDQESDQKDKKDSPLHCKVNVINKYKPATIYLYSPYSEI